MSKQISGIYEIVNKINSKRYVGSSKSVHYRWNQSHRSLLRKGKHPNSHLQRSWNKYGESNFEFSIIEECEEKLLAAREEFWIECHKSWERANGYNLTRIVNGRQVISEETRLKISQASKKYPEETYEKIREWYKNGVSKNAIASQLGLVRQVVYHHLEVTGLYKNQGRGKGLKLTKSKRDLIKALRIEGLSWEDILEQTGISRTQVYRTKVAGDGTYCSAKVKRQTYRTVTPEIISQVAVLRQQNKTWEEIEKIVGVSRFALHQNGITAQHKRSRKGETRKKLSTKDKERIITLLAEGKSVTEVSNLLGIAQSTVRSQRKKLC